MLNRRDFLRAAGATGALAASGAAAGSGLSGLGAGTAGATTLTNAEVGTTLRAAGIEHVVVLMLENRSFDHLLSWLPGADGRHDLTFPAPDGHHYPNYPLAPDFQGCGYSDPDHSWEGWLVEHNNGALDGFLMRPTPPSSTSTAPRAAANTFPVGYYTNVNPDGTPKSVPDLPVLGALARNYTVLDRYFSSFAGETYPNRFYQHSARTDRDHNSTTTSTMPAIWDQLAALETAVVPGTTKPTGLYFFKDIPFLALWGTKYSSYIRPYSSATVTTVAGGGVGAVSKLPAGAVDSVMTPSVAAGLGAASGTPFLNLITSRNLPNVSYVDPAFEDEGSGTSGDYHPLCDIRVGEQFVADVYHALKDNGYLSKTVLVITFDEWGGFYDHVDPPHVVDTTDPTTVSHSSDVTTLGLTHPDYTQLGFRVPCIVVSDFAPAQVVHDGPYEHASTLAMIESIFNLSPMTARDANANNLGAVLSATPRTDTPSIPTSADVIAMGAPASGLLAACSVTSTRSVSPAPVDAPVGLPEAPVAIGLPLAGAAIGAAALLARRRGGPEGADAGAGTAGATARGDAAGGDVAHGDAAGSSTDGRAAEDR